MPNWVKSVIKTKPDVLEDIMKKYSNEKGLDFQKIIPMPKDLDIEYSVGGVLGLVYLFLDNNCSISKELIAQTFQNVSSVSLYESDALEIVKRDYNQGKEIKECKRDIELAKKYISNYEKYGQATWYEWRIKNWGTKCNNIGFKRSNNTMIFETAWGFPEEIILELSQKYPDTTFRCKFADELIPENSGKLLIQDGEIYMEKYYLTNKERKNIWNNTLYNTNSEKDIDNDYERDY